MSFFQTYFVTHLQSQHNSLQNREQNKLFTLIPAIHPLKRVFSHHNLLFFQEIVFDQVYQIVFQFFIIDVNFANFLIDLEFAFMVELRRCDHLVY